MLNVFSRSVGQVLEHFVGLLSGFCFGDQTLWPSPGSSHSVSSDVFPLLSSTRVRKCGYLTYKGSLPSPVLALQQDVPSGWRRNWDGQALCRYLLLLLPGLTQWKMTSVALLFTSSGIRMAVVIESNRLYLFPSTSAGGTCILSQDLCP